MEVKQPPYLESCKECPKSAQLVKFWSWQEFIFSLDEHFYLGLSIFVDNEAKNACLEDLPPWRSDGLSFYGI